MNDENEAARRRQRAKYIDDIAECTAIMIGKSIENLVRACDPAALLVHLWTLYRGAACGVMTGKKAGTLAAIDCPACLLLMYQTSVANAFVRGGEQS